MFLCRFLFFVRSFSVINGLVDGDYPDEIDMLDGIVPTFTPNPSYPPAPFVPIDPAVNPGYSDPNQFAPTGSINHHPELVSISPFPTNQNNNSHVVASSNHVHPTIQSADLASDRVATVPAGETAMCKHSCHCCRSPILSMLTTLFFETSLIVYQFHHPFLHILSDDKIALLKLCPITFV